MADSSSVDVILEFLKQNKFTKAMAALRSEFGNRPNLNVILQKLMLDDKESVRLSVELVPGEEDKIVKATRHGGGSLKGSITSSTLEVSKELIVKEVDSGTGRNGSENKWKIAGTVSNQAMVGENVAASEKNYTNVLDDAVLDLHPINTSNGTVFQNDVGGANENNFLGFHVPGNAKINSAETHESCQVHPKSGEEPCVSGEKIITWSGSVSIDLSHDKNSEHKEVDQQRMPIVACLKDDLVDNIWSGSDISDHPSTELEKEECPVKIVFSSREMLLPFMIVPLVLLIDRKEKRKTGVNSITEALKEQVMRWVELFSLG